MSHSNTALHASQSVNTVGFESQGQKRVCELAVIGVLLGVDDSLSCEAREWVQRKIADIKMEFTTENKNSTNTDSSSGKDLSSDLSDSAHKTLSELQDRTIGSRIQLARENLGLTETDLARALNIYSDHISDWECDIYDVPAKQILPLCGALKCDPLWLLGDGEGFKPEGEIAVRTNPPLSKEAELNIPAFLRHPRTCPETPIDVLSGVDMSTIWKRINERRRELGVSVEETARDLDVTPMQLQSWEAGRAYPTNKQIDELSLVLGCRVMWLLTGRGEAETVVQVP